MITKSSRQEFDYDIETDYQKGSIQKLINQEADQNEHYLSSPKATSNDWKT